MASKLNPSSAPEGPLSRLWQLDRDAELAYSAAAGRVRRPALRRGLRTLAADCRRHVDELAPYLPSAGTSAGPADDERRLLRAGRLMLAQVLGDAAVLEALGDVVRAGNQAYADALADGHLSAPARAVVQRNACDERRHEHWLQAARHRPAAQATTVDAAPPALPKPRVAWDDVAAESGADADVVSLALPRPPPT